MKLRRRQFLQLPPLPPLFRPCRRSPARRRFRRAPITMVVPVPAGGALDTNARLVASGMSAALGQTVVIENVTGASGSTGTGRVARVRTRWLHADLWRQRHARRSTRRC